jgi:2-deoxy-D-gluconate 3-dehydrogenase
MDKVAVVTGGRRGIGLACVKGFLKEGYRVAVIAKSDAMKDPNDDFLDDELYYISANLHVDRYGLIKRVRQRFGRVDVLVNNAGVCQQKTALEYGGVAFEHDINLMLQAALELSQEAYKFGVRRIINISSIAAHNGARYELGYAVAKAGLERMTKSLAIEWALDGITVNTVCPGFIETDMLQPLLDYPAHAEAIKGRIPAGKFGKPEDVAAAVLFLASDAAQYINGATILVDGGWSAR